MKYHVILMLCVTASSVLAKPDTHIGNGVWIWQLKKTENGDVDAITRKAKAAHLDHILIRVTSNGDSWAHFNPKAKVRKLAKALKAEGIKVFAWGYNFPQDKKIARQVKLIEAVLLDPVFDGYVYNVETEFAYRSKSADALFAPVKAFRDKYCPNKLLGFSTYCRVDRGAGASMPADTFADYCDVGMPQAYWRDFNWTPKKTIYQMCLAWGDKVDAGYVLIPTGHAYDGQAGTQLIPSLEVAQFLKASSNYYGRNLYVWERMTPRQWEILELGVDAWVSLQAAESIVVTAEPIPTPITRTEPDEPAKEKHSSPWGLLIIWYLISFLRVYGLVKDRDEEPWIKGVVLLLMPLYVIPMDVYLLVRFCVKAVRGLLSE